MAKIPDFVTDKGVDILIEMGGEVFGEIAADFFLGRRGKDDTVRTQFLDMLKKGDREGLKGLVKTNPLGWGLGDEQSMEDDLVAIVVSGMVSADEAAALDQFFYSKNDPPPQYCMSERERTKYRIGHMYQKDLHIRRRNLVVLAKLPNHKARRQKVGSTGKLDRTLPEKGWDYLTKESPEITASMSALDTRIAAEKAKFNGQRLPFWQSPLFLRIRTRLGI